MKITELLPSALIGADRPTLAGRKKAMARIGQTRSGLIEDALIVGLTVARFSRR